MQPYASFAEFYPFYLSQHRHPVCRSLHVAGTLLSFALALFALWQGAWWLIAAALAQGYAFAWVGHFVFEHNRPATFRYPLYSFMGDWVMTWQIVTGSLSAAQE